MESWRLVWRNGFVPIFTLDELRALREAVATDDPRLLQGCTTSPPPLMCVQDWPCEGGCLLSYPGVAVNGGFDKDRDGKIGNPTACTVGTAEEMFAKKCFDADQLLGEPAACRWLLNWFDETPRDEMLRELLPEIDLAISLREGVERDAAAVSPPEPGGSEGPPS